MNGATTTAATAVEHKASSTGLEGVNVADTLISEVDGANGRLIIAGYTAETLATTLSFEQLAHLLWTGEEANAQPKSALISRFGLARVAAFARLEACRSILNKNDAMDSLRSFISLIDLKAADDLKSFTHMASAMAVFVGNWTNLVHERPLVAPDASLEQSADILRMLHGETPSAALSQALNTYLVTVSDHGMNASTFTARVVASTDSDNVSCITAAIGALKGPLHGGAPGPVLRMLKSIGSAQNARPWLEKELSEGRRIMGMGHRVYRVRDPRAAIFEQAVRRLAQEGLEERLALASAVEREAETILRECYPERNLKANVEFFTSVLLDSLDVPEELFTPMFAVGRVAGWCAHVLEQRGLRKLIRPASRYVGVMRDQ